LILDLVAVVIVIAVEEHPKLLSMAVACCLKSAACYDVSCPLPSFAFTWCEKAFNVLQVAHNYYESIDLAEFS
jgi:hypothetical protein